MVDSNPRIPSRDDIRRLFEQLPDDGRPGDERNAPTPPPTDGHEESPHA